MAAVQSSGHFNVAMKTLTFSDQGLPDRDIQGRRRVSGIEQVLLSWRLPEFHVSW